MTTTANPGVPDIINNYRKLCAYCDSIWNRAREVYSNEIACRKGCGICCELRSVNQIEAYVIRSHITDNNTSVNDIDNNDVVVHNDNATVDDNACPFLRNQACTVYPARPIICRTHGMILRSSEFSPSRQATSCPYNFTSIHPNDFPPEMTIDTDVVTKNLVRLNLAFCLASGISVGDGAENRVLLRDLLSPPDL